MANMANLENVMTTYGGCIRREFISFSEITIWDGVVRLNGDIVANGAGVHGV